MARPLYCIKQLFPGVLLYGSSKDLLVQWKNSFCQKKVGGEVQIRKVVKVNLQK